MILCQKSLSELSSVTPWLIMMMTAHPTDTVVPRGPSRQTSALVEAALTPTGRHRLPAPRYCNAQTAVEKINLGICFCAFLFVYFYLCILFWSLPSDSSQVLFCRENPPTSNPQRKYEFCASKLLHRKYHFLN